MTDPADQQDPQTVEHERQGLAAIVESSDDAIIGSTLAGVITSWNRAAEILYGYAPEEVLGKHFSLLLCTPDQRDELTETLARITDDERVGAIDTTLRAKSGGVIQVVARTSPIRDGHGRVVGAASASRDASQSESVQRALREAEERFRRAFEEAPIGMAILGLDGRFQQVNSAFCELAGYTVDQLQATSTLAITHPDDFVAEQDELRRVLAGASDGYRVEKRYLHASGRTVWVSQQVSLLGDRAGAPPRLLVHAQDVTDQRRYEERLRHLADHDALTGLLNRSGFGRELEAHRLRASRYGLDGAVLMLDLDQFKFINDTLGHQAGDQAIMQAAGALRARLRETDVLARLGGDEFGILLPHADTQAAMLVADELLQALRSESVELGGRLRPLAASAGIAMFDDKGLSGEDVLVNADLAMYDAKHTGRDQRALYRDDAHARSRMKGRITWAQRISGAIQHDGFILMTQSIIELATGSATQHELLLRLRDEHGDLVPPGAFLYIAERLGMITEIDEWVTRQAIDLIAKGGTAGRQVVLEVNLSALSIGHSDLLEVIARELQRTQIPPASLIFEITETAAVANIIQAERFAQALAKLGCRFALDDFGAGYGSFYHLKHIPFDYLKIDGDFVRSATTSETDRLLIKAVVDIARSMGKQTIAEYVGDEQTLDLLRRLGVDYGQGYHLGRPVPVNGSTPAIARPSPRVSDGTRPDERQDHA